MTEGRILRAYGSFPVNSFVFQRTFPCRTPFYIVSDELSHYGFSPFVVLLTSCFLADLRLLTWSSFNVQRFSVDYFLRIKWIGLSEIREFLLVNAKYVLLDPTSSCESVVSHGMPVVVCLHSSEKAFFSCRFLDKSGIDISSRTDRRQLYSTAEERFSS